MRYLSSTYTALILSIAFWVAFHSLLKLSFRYESEQRIDANLNITYAIQLQPGIEDEQLSTITSEIEDIYGISEANSEIPIPEWQGPEEQTEEWQELWKSYLPPLIMAQSELTVENYDIAPEIANEIATISGVNEVQWDEEIYQEQSTVLSSLNKKHTFLSTLFFISFLALTLGLIISYPERLRRNSVIRLGFFGAGPKMNPETLWIRIALLHSLVAVILYCFLWIIGYIFFPLPLRAGGSPGFFWLLIEGSVIIFIFIFAVCATGWWLHSDVSDSTSTYRPPTIS